MSGYTKGPWRIGTIRQQRVDKRLQPMFEVPIHYGDGNCHTIIYGGGSGALYSDEASVMANARLIAAAPELLEALKMMRDEFRALDLPYGSEAYAAAISAINKAESQS